MFGKAKRFQDIYKESCAGGELHILVDMATGVNYLCMVGMGPMSITPLLDENGNVVVSRKE